MLRFLTTAGTWIMTGLLISFDSYIAFSFLVPLIGTAIVWRDGIGRIRDLTQVRECFLGTHRSMLYGKFARLADQFVTKCLPSVKATHEKLQALAKAAPTDAWLHTAVHTSSVDYLFAKAWNLFVSTLREEDLVNDLELSRMTYGPSASGMPTALPLFLIGDALPHVADMVRPHALMRWFCSCAHARARSVSPTVHTRHVHYCAPRTCAGVGNAMGEQHAQ
ncbi:hypothetical protein EON66_03435 [archaeon]|nr:MAG: hypothetical protein EON66_03435 [archaeon]